MNSLMRACIAVLALALFGLAGCVPAVSHEKYVDDMIRKCPDRIISSEGSYCVGYKKVAMVRRSPALLKRKYIEQGLKDLMGVGPYAAGSEDIARAVQKGLCTKKSVGLYYRSGSNRVYSVIWFDPEKSELNFAVTRAMTESGSIPVPGEDANTGFDCDGQEIPEEYR